MCNGDFLPSHIEVRGARVNNLQNLDVDIPLHRLVCVCGVSGSGKSSLAMDTLYAEGARRYLETLSTYTRRRLSQAPAPKIDSIRYLPCALALRQRPSLPGPRSTVGTLSEAFNVLRLIFSRLGTHRCACGQAIAPTLIACQTGRIVCPACHKQSDLPSAESFAFNSGGACPVCDGLGTTNELDPDALIGDSDKSIRDGAVAAWHIAGGMLLQSAAMALGVRTDVPYRDLTDAEKDIVLHGKPQTVRVAFGGPGKSLDIRFLNAADAVQNRFSKADSSRALESLGKFYHTQLCPGCHGTRFSERALGSTLDGRNIAEVSALTLSELSDFLGEAQKGLPGEMLEPAQALIAKLRDYVEPLLRLGLDYLSLSRPADTLSTGELQRLHLTRILRNEATGVLYVLDEPSVGLHPENVRGLMEILRHLLRLGNSVVAVDHDTDVLEQSDYLLELGPGAGRNGGRLLACGSLPEVCRSERSMIAPYLAGTCALVRRAQKTPDELRACKRIGLKVGSLYTLHDLSVAFPIGALTAVTGVSGAGKTALVLDCLVPALQAALASRPLPEHVIEVSAGDVKRVVIVDASPIGKNDRSTIATYSGIFDGIRALFSKTDEARARKWGPGRFAYNTQDGVCETCGGVGRISVDVQFMPNMDVVCPDCLGKRYTPDTLCALWHGYSIADILALSLEDALGVFADEPPLLARVRTLVELGLGYLKLGEPTPSLSGGEAQRLKLMSEMGGKQQGTLFVFDEPTTGLHPDDVTMLMSAMDKLLCAGGTIVAIEHDLDLIANADYVLDMGPGGGTRGGSVVASGTPSEVAANAQSVTGRHLARHIQKFARG